MALYKHAVNEKVPQFYCQVICGAHLVESRPSKIFERRENYNYQKKIEWNSYPQGCNIKLFFQSKLI